MPVKLVKDSTKGLVDKERYSESTVQFHKPELVPILVVSKTTVLFVFERRKNIYEFPSENRKVFACT